MAYEFDGEKYKQASGHQKEWGQKVISDIVLAGAETILDLGCGDGRLSKQLADLATEGKVLGIDASQGMIKTAREVEGLNLSFLCLDINDMDFDSEFDLIFSNAALHWVKDHDRLLKNCRRALKDNGLIRFNFAGDGNCANFFEVIREVMNHPAYREFFQDYCWPWYMPKVGDYEKLVAKHGFKELKVWEENADRYFAGPDDLIKWIDQPSIVPFLKSVPETLKDRFRNEVVGRMVDRTLQSDGTCFETFRRINVLAQK